MTLTHRLCTALMMVLLAAPIAGTAQPATPTVTVDAQHRALATLAGRWNVRQSFWATPGATPKLDKGTADFTMVLNQRHLRQTLHIADGTQFEGLGYIGYDNTSAQFFSTWMDVNFPGLVVARGEFDAASKAYVFHGSMTAAPPGSGTIPVREVMTLIDNDHFTYEYFETHQGRETLTIRLEYARAG